MNNEIAEIFKSLLIDYEANPGKDINELIKEALEKHGLSTEEISEAMTSLDELDAINESARSLEKAREDGASRIEWMEENLSALTETMPTEMAEDFCKDVVSLSEEVIKNNYDLQNKSI